MKHFISIADASVSELRHVLDVAARLKKQLKTTGRNDPIFANKTLAMIFEKPSLRTRTSFAVAMTQLGGNGLLLRDEEVGLDKREPTEDVARVLASMCDGIMARTFEQEKLNKLAKFSSVPVINGLTDFSHPCQAMADLMTIEEHFGNLAGRTVAYIGDGNNVARSLALACGKFEMKFVIASPVGYELDDRSVEQIKAQVPGINYSAVRNPNDAAAHADVLYTDTWVSMGQEAEKTQRVADFDKYQINQQLLNKAPAQCMVMHCLPAYRGLEITADVMEGPRSLIFAQAENRLHFQKGLLAVLMGGQ